MAPVELPYLWLPTFRGRQYAYYRRNGRQTRLPAPTDPGFLAAYEAAHVAASALVQRRSISAELPGSLSALMTAYMASPQWGELRPRTRRDYRENLDALRTRCGDVPVRTMPTEFVVKLRDEFAAREGKPTPRRAGKMLAVLRLLLSWGRERGWLKGDNPAAGVRPPKGGPGYQRWTGADIERFLSCPAVGEPMKRALVLGFYTGQRKADCLALTKAARSGGAIELVQKKTGKRVWIPEHPELTRWLDAAPATDAVTILTGANGRPWSESGFGHAFAAAVRTAGLPPGRSFHGLRKGLLATLAELGATPHEMMAMSGHETMSEVTRYTEEADQRGRARAAVARLQRRKNVD